MSTNIKIRLEFQSEAGQSRSFSDSLSHERDASDEGKENLAREIFAELRKAIVLAEHANKLPDVDDLLEQSGYVRNDPMGFVDIFNVPGMWLEISNTYTDLRYVLAQAKAYKDLEPLNTTPLSDALCAFLHFEKMYKLNLAVFQLVKIQDLVVRLLHECFSGSLIPVDCDDEDWEQKLTLRDAKKGLKALSDKGELAHQEYKAIVEALEYPSKSSHRTTVLEYRNRLTHRIRPSVDYPELYTDLQDRAGKVIRDASGRERARTYSIGGGRATPEFLFSDLYTAISDYMGHIAGMLKTLKHIPRLS